jgi:hypothetical protein
LCKFNRINLSKLLKLFICVNTLRTPEAHSLSTCQQISEKMPRRSRHWTQELSDNMVLCSPHYAYKTRLLFHYAIIKWTLYTGPRNVCSMCSYRCCIICSSFHYGSVAQRSLLHCFRVDKSIFAFYSRVNVFGVGWFPWVLTMVYNTQNHWVCGLSPIVWNSKFRVLAKYWVRTDAESWNLRIWRVLTMVYNPQNPLGVMILSHP